MLKLNASYAKKVPADSQYSSQSYHAQVEIELPDGLTQEQLRAKVHDVFEFVRTSVENELHNTASAPDTAQPRDTTAPLQSPGFRLQAPPHQYPQKPLLDKHPVTYQPPRNMQSVASEKQRNYLLALVKRAGWTLQQLLEHCRIDSIDQISARLCSQLIQEFTGQPA